MNSTVSQIVAAPIAIRGLVNARMEDFVVRTHPSQLVGNLVGRASVLGISYWLLGGTISVTTVVGFVLMLGALGALVAATRRRSPVSNQERQAAMERPCILSVLGQRIPITSVAQWFASSFGRRYSRSLLPLLMKLGAIVSIGLLNGTGIGVMQGSLLVAYPLCAYFLSKK